LLLCHGGCLHEQDENNDPDRAKSHTPPFESGQRSPPQGKGGIDEFHRTVRSGRRDRAQRRGRLADARDPYRVVGRHAGPLTATFGSDPLAEVVTWNPDDPASVRAAATGLDTIVYLVGVPYNHFELHPIVMRQTLEGAIAAGVRRIVLIGTVYAYGLPTTPTVAEDHPRDPTTFKGRMRKAQEDVLLQAHADGRIEATILRLPDFYWPGVEASLLAGAFRAAKHGGTADLIGPIGAPHEFVYVPDVGPVVLDLAATPAAYGLWWNLAGAGVTTQRALATAIFAAAGRPSKLRIANKTILRAIGVFNPLMRELVEMHYLMTTPVLLDDEALHALLGTIAKTPYDEGIRRTLAATG
jgi:nucleoside-diphosphate-sugar epimerase